MKAFILAQKQYIVLVFIFVAFLFLRLPAVHFPYYQDEYKWPLYAYNIGYEPGAVPHPPLSEFIYKVTGMVFTDNDFRFTPLIFSGASLFLLYFVVRRRYGVSPAMWATSFFALSFYGVLASLTIDTDGAILPFFFLLSILFYDLFYDTAGRKKILWGSLFVISVALGLLVKISFALCVMAIVLDFIIKERHKINKRYLINIVLITLGFLVVFSSALFISKFIFPGFSMTRAFSYWDTFVKSFFDRNFFQTGIQFTKSLLYTSPFFVFIGLSSLYPYRKDFSLFHIFIGIGLLFYLFVFDFSGGALDRYFAFLVVPLSVIAGVIASERIKNLEILRKPYLIAGAVVIFTISVLQKLPQAVPALHPKAEWIDRILSFNWNFLYPFSGGSGPSGFYISFMFLGLCWVAGLALFVWYMKSKSALKSTVFAIFIMLGLVYNGAFIEEYLFGSKNGSSPKLTINAVDFIKHNPNIEKVIVYNDMGGYSVKQTGKYFRRMYATPNFEEEYKDILENYSGYVLYVDVPKIYTNSVYSNFIQSCSTIYSEQDKYITAKVLDCRK